ncbi:tyrosine-type recombinase/integrase [Alicyclobacillus sendaiensis]|uniref:tyrosine-type recombinase/integrase n=1 Tax=Alicyclobacillus sendaiensis TaxID=192387 RepID=UPI000784A1F7|nr:tyrosine-type recombinase/integrase [Alicyclobacillus sendaiensis]
MLGEEAITEFGAHLVRQGRSRKTVIGYQSDLRRFAAFYAARHNLPWSVEETTVEDLRAYLEASPGQATTINRRLYALRSFFKYLVRQGMVSSNPAEMLEAKRTVQKERYALPAHELARFIHHIPHPHVQAAAWTMAYTGLRIAEIIFLRMEDVDFEEGVIRVAHGKGDKPREVPICDALRQVLSQYVEQYRTHAKPHERFFATPSTGGLSPTHINRVLKQTSLVLGYRRYVTAHTFRHSFASNLIRQGVHLILVQKLLGHSSPTVTAVYTHATREDLQRAVQMLSFEEVQA